MVMALRGLTIWVKCVIAGLLAVLALLYALGTVSVWYIRHNFMRYYGPFAKMELGMSRAEVNELAAGWRLDSDTGREGQAGRRDAVEVYRMCIQYEGGDFIRLYYEDSLLTRKEAFSRRHKVLTNHDMVRVSKSFWRDMVSLVVGWTLGSAGIVLFPWFRARRRMATSEREELGNTWLVFLSGFLAAAGSAILVGVSSITGFIAFFLLLGQLGAAS